MKRFKIKYVMTLVCICFLYTACSFNNTETIELTWMPAPDPQGQLDIYVEEGIITYGKVNETETAAIIRLTEEQRKNWLADIVEEIDKYVKEANQDEHMQIEISEDAKKITVYGDRYMNFYTWGEYFVILGYDMELQQLLEGEEDWKFTHELYDLDTGKLLLSAVYPDEKIKFNRELWNQE